MRTSTEIPTRGGALVTGYDDERMRDEPNTEYGVVTEEQLWDNLKYFLERIVPVAEEANVKLAMHPDDPACFRLSEGLVGLCEALRTISA